MNLDKTARFRRRITLLAVLIVAAALWYFFSRYGTWTVIPGMDTMLPGYPPGATCVIEKDPGEVTAGKSVVILELPGGAALLTKVVRVEGERIFIRHDNRQSRFLHYEKQSYAMASVRGLVLTVLLPDDAPAEVPRGK